MIDGPRGLVPSELDELMELVKGAFGSQMRDGFPTLFCAENAHYMRVIKVDGIFVSHIGIVVRDMIINGCRISVGNVGAVCTHKDYRKRGYAWLNFEDSMDKCRAEGVDMFLVSGFRSLYQLHGCTHVGKVARYFVAPNIELTAQVRPFKQEDLPAWARLYRSEPVRFQRPYDDFQKLAEKMPAHRRMHFYSLWENGSITSYAVLVRSREHNLYFVEYAGSRRAILSGVNDWCEEFKAPGVEISVPVHDSGFGGMLESVGAKAKSVSTGGTITILHFPRLCRKLMPLFEEIVGCDMARRLTFRELGGSNVISLDGDEVVLSPHDSARLIFGNPADRNERTEINTQGKLREVLEAIFPVPRPEYGLSYI